MARMGTREHSVNRVCVASATSLHSFSAKEVCSPRCSSQGLRGNAEERKLMLTALKAWPRGARAVQTPLVEARSPWEEDAAFKVQNCTAWGPSTLSPFRAPGLCPALLIVESQRCQSITWLRQVRHLRRRARALGGGAAQQLIVMQPVLRRARTRKSKISAWLTDLSPRAAKTSRLVQKKCLLLLGKGMRQALDRIIDLGGSDRLCLRSLGTSSACRTRRPISSARLFLRLCEQSCIQMVFTI